MTVGNTQFSAQEVTGLLGMPGFPISGATIPPGYVGCWASLTDDKAVALPNSASALLNGRAFYGVSCGFNTSTSDDRSVPFQRDGIVKAYLKTNTACTAGQQAAYDPADGGVVVPYTSAVQVPIGKFTQTKAAVSGGQFVGVELTPGISGGGYDGMLLMFANPQAGSASSIAENAYSNATLTIPANFLRVGDVIEYVAALDVSNQNGTDKLVVRWKIGSTTIVQTAATYDPATGDDIVLRGSIGVDDIGATATPNCAGTVIYGAAATAGVAIAGIVFPSTDTTAAVSITLTAQWDASSANNLCDLKNAYAVLRRKSA